MKNDRRLRRLVVGEVSWYWTVRQRVSDATRRRYHSRPFLVLHAERFAQALNRTVTHPELRSRPLIGSVDQWADSTDFLGLVGRQAVGSRPFDRPL